MRISHLLQTGGDHEDRPYTSILARAVQSPRQGRRPHQRATAKETQSPRLGADDEVCLGACAADRERPPIQIRTLRFPMATQPAVWKGENAAPLTTRRSRIGGRRMSARRDPSARRETPLVTDGQAYRLSRRIAVACGTVRSGDREAAASAGLAGRQSQLESLFPW